MTQCAVAQILQQRALLRGQQRMPGEHGPQYLIQVAPGKNLGNRLAGKALRVKQDRAPSPSGVQPVPR